VGAACVTFLDPKSDAIAFEFDIVSSGSAEAYEPGQFYRREPLSLYAFRIARRTHVLARIEEHHRESVDRVRMNMQMWAIRRSVGSFSEQLTLHSP
jgi:hypothetical protein